MGARRFSEGRNVETKLTAYIERSGGSYEGHYFYGDAGYCSKPHFRGESPAAVLAKIAKHSGYRPAEIKVVRF
jgi:hypothetical protein